MDTKRYYKDTYKDIFRKYPLGIFKAKKQAKKQANVYLRKYPYKCLNIAYQRVNNAFIVITSLMDTKGYYKDIYPLDTKGYYSPLIKGNILYPLALSFTLRGRLAC